VVQDETRIFDKTWMFAANPFLSIQIDPPQSPCLVTPFPCSKSLVADRGSSLYARPPLQVKPDNGGRSHLL